MLTMKDKYFDKVIITYHSKQNIKIIKIKYKDYNHLLSFVRVHDTYQKIVMTNNI